MHQSMKFIKGKLIIVYVIIVVTEISISECNYNLELVDEDFQDQWNLYESFKSDDRDKRKLILSNQEPYRDIRKSCWLNLDIRNLFKNWKQLNERYDKVRASYDEAVATEEFDKQMVMDLVQNSGRAYRALHNFDDNTWLIPAGLNLGGYSMMATKGSMLFFHRMKLRNDTRFTIKYLHTSLYNMTLEMILSLNDLHLVGEYERVKAKRGSNIMFYHPTFGHLEIVLRQTKFRILCLYRMMKDRLLVELIHSKFLLNDTLITFHNNGVEPKTEKGSEKLLAEFLTRMRLDLNHWLKDFINDYLAFLPLKDVDIKEQFLDYQKKKVLLLSEYVDSALERLTVRMRQLRARALKLPQYTIITSTGMKIILRRGVLRGLDSMHRVSQAAGATGRESAIIKVIIGFSKLKVEYRYVAQVMPGVPPLFGTLMLNAEQMEALMTLVLKETPEAFAFKLMFHDQTKPEHLTVVGALNRRISNFKHILQTQLFTIMSSMIYLHIQKLQGLNECNPDPPLPRHIDTGEVFSGENVKKCNLEKSNGSGVNDNNENKVAFAVNREDNAEIILPPEDGEKVGKTVKLKYEEHFYVNEQSDQ